MIGYPFFEGVTGEPSTGLVFTDAVLVLMG